LKSIAVCAAILSLILPSAAISAQTKTQSGNGPKEILVHGHRGARAWRPENTIPAFQFAIDHGVDVLELDLAVTKDNVLVVSHNPTLCAQSEHPGERVCKGPELAPARHPHHDAGRGPPIRLRLGGAKHLPTQRPSLERR
jgi:glycerophosphoryl diester phosphodiesterase